DVIGNAVGREAEIDPGIAVELERAIDALGGLLDRGDQLGREVLGRTDVDTVALLVFEVVLDLLGGDRPRALRQTAEIELPDRENAQAVVAEHADIDFATLDILLGNRGGADPLMDECYALGELLIAVDHRRLRDAVGGVLAQALDDERQAETGWAANLAPQRKHRK